MSKTIMIDPVGPLCNLSCSYCYQSSVSNNNHNIMSEKILDNVIKKVLEYEKFKDVKFLWHGGEPLIAGKHFFKKAVELQKKYKKAETKIKNTIQTNATLIDKEWADFFSSNNFSIGTSIDGPKKVHDRVRDGSYSKVMKGVYKLKDQNVKISIIILVSSENVGHASDIWYKIIKPQKIFSSCRINLCSNTSNSYLAPSDNKAIAF